MKRHDTDPSDVLLLPNSGAEDGILESKGGSMLESASTSVTAGYDSSSEAEEVGWLGGIGADFRSLAVSLRATAGGVAHVVKTCAINVAAEIAQLEDEEGANGSSGETLYLPWEVFNQETGEYQEDQDLKTKIFELSKDERNFFEPYSSKRNSKNNEESDDDSGDFVLDDARVRVIRELLKMDPPLSAMHARLSGRSDIRETNFWRNYFFACDETREYHLNCVELDQKLEVLSQHSFASQQSLELDQKSSASQRSLNSLVPDDDLSNDNASKEPTSPSVADDSSFVCVSTGRNSPPGSVKSFRSSKSAGSMVMVEAPSKRSFMDYLSFEK